MISCITPLGHGTKVWTILGMPLGPSALAARRCLPRVPAEWAIPRCAGAVSVRYAGHEQAHRGSRIENNSRNLAGVRRTCAPGANGCQRSSGTARADGGYVGRLVLQRHYVYPVRQSGLHAWPTQHRVDSGQACLLRLAISTASHSSATPAGRSSITCRACAIPFGICCWPARAPGCCPTFRSSAGRHVPCFLLQRAVYATSTVH